MTETITNRAGRRYVRTFLFSMRIDSPLAKLHVMTKVIAILATSVLIIHLMDSQDPDPLGTGLLMATALAFLLFSGAGRWLYRSYLIVIFPMLGVIFLTWILFNPDPGTVTYFQITLYKPLRLVVSDANLLVALTKVMGYAAMVFVSLTLVMTTRDVEFVGAMQQLRLPYVATFFLSIILRTLNSAVMDFETIRQAQWARGLGLKPRSLFTRLQHLAHLSVPLVATMMRRSTDISDAALARGFRLDQTTPTEYHEAQPWQTHDWFVLAVQALLFIIVFGLSINLTHLVGWP